jgi:hypothetical protein
LVSEARKAHVTVELDTLVVVHLVSFTLHLKQIRKSQSIGKEVAVRHGSLVPTEMDQQPLLYLHVGVKVCWKAWQLIVPLPGIWKLTDES